MQRMLNVIEVKEVEVLQNNSEAALLCLKIKA